MTTYQITIEYFASNRIFNSNFLDKLFAYEKTTAAALIIYRSLQ